MERRPRRPSRRIRFLNIARADSPDPAVAGTDNITYTLSYSKRETPRHGCRDLRYVPAATTFVSATGGGTLGGGVVTWTSQPGLGGLRVGAVHRVHSNTPVANGRIVTNSTYSSRFERDDAGERRGGYDDSPSDPRFVLVKSDAPDRSEPGAIYVHPVLSDIARTMPRGR